MRCKSPHRCHSRDPHHRGCSPRREPSCSNADRRSTHSAPPVLNAGNEQGRCDPREGHGSCSPPSWPCGPYHGHHGHYGHHGHHRGFFGHWPYGHWGHHMRFRPFEHHGPHGWHRGWHHGWPHRGHHGHHEDYDEGHQCREGACYV